MGVGQVNPVEPDGRILLQFRKKCDPKVAPKKAAPERRYTDWPPSDWTKTGLWKLSIRS